ncbi:hypothetical protein ACIQU8_16430 [Streptomyces griseus]|uniref:hypothetical protein n=1 Tax=Streptomyces griseus TaxID=1911 RepID=UPI0038144161
MRRLVHLPMSGLGDAFGLFCYVLSRLVMAGLLGAVIDMYGCRFAPDAQSRADSKAIRCELVTGLRSSVDHMDGPRVARAEALFGLLGVFGRDKGVERGPLTVAHAEEPAIDVIADLLRRLRAHGCDPDGALGRAQAHFEAEPTEAA